MTQERDDAIALIDEAVRVAYEQAYLRAEAQAIGTGRLSEAELFAAYGQSVPRHAYPHPTTRRCAGRGCLTVIPIERELCHYCSRTERRRE